MIFPLEFIFVFCNWFIAMASTSFGIDQVPVRDDVTGRLARSEPRSPMSGRNSFRSDQTGDPGARDPVIGPIAGAPGQQQAFRFQRPPK
jgi:hypothetical protein